MAEFVERRTIDPINRHEFDGISQWVKDIDTKMTLHTQQEIRMESRLDELEKDLKEVKEIVKDLRDIWTQSKGAVRFLTVVISVLASGWAFLVWSKDHIKL